MLDNINWQNLSMGRARNQPLVLYCIRRTKRRDHDSKQDNESVTFLNTILPSLVEAYLKLTLPANNWLLTNRTMALRATSYQNVDSIH
jgi:hypothetical protein